MPTLYPGRVPSLRFFAAVLLLTILGFTSCQKNKTPAEETKPQAAAPTGTERLLSVANVYYTADGRNAEAWFYETPLVYEFSASAAYAKENFQALQYAKENKLPVNVTTYASTENLIARITPATEEQVQRFREDAAKRPAAEQVPSPDDPNPSFANPQPSSLTAVVPNTTVLNNIFNTIKSQCCKLPAVLLYPPCIPFQFVADGCYARAHKMRQIIESYYGYTSYKVFNYACNGAGTLSVSATLWGNNCCVKWWYHVTSYVYVQSGSSQVAYAIDPAMFNGPVSISTWVAAQKNVGCGYNGSAQGQVYYTSNAYAPSSLNTGTCTLVPFADNTYTAANNTCTAYSGKQGCSF